MALALLTTPGLAAAQIRALPAGTFDPPQRSITIAVSNDLLYDTNVARGSDAAARLRGITKQDVRATPAAAIDLTLPSGRASVTMRGSVATDVYARNARLNRERIDLTAGATVPLAFCVATPEIGYARVQNDLLDLSIDPEYPLLSAVNVQTVRRAGTAVHCGRTWGLRPGGFVDRARTSNSAAPRRGQNVDQLGYGAELSYASPTVGVLAAFVRRRVYDYDERRDGRLAGPPRFRVTTSGVRVDRRLGARLQLVGSLSYAAVTFSGNPGSDGDLSGLNWSLAATLRLGDRVLVAANSERVIEPAFGFFANAVRRTMYGGSITYALSPLAQVGASLSRRDRVFRGAVSGLVPALTADTTDQAMLRLDYGRDPIRMRLSASYQRRTADLDLYDYDGLLFALSLGYQFRR